MSVQIHIAIGDGVASRHLSIDLQTDPKFDENGRRDQDEVGTYMAVLTGGHWSKRPAVGGEFPHRYGDDVLTLINEAIAAIREAGVEQA